MSGRRVALSLLVERHDPLALTTPLRWKLLDRMRYELGLYVTIEGLALGAVRWKIEPGPTPDTVRVQARSIAQELGR